MVGDFVCCSLHAATERLLLPLDASPPPPRRFFTTQVAMPARKKTHNPCSQLRSECKSTHTHSHYLQPSTMTSTTPTPTSSKSKTLGIYLATNGSQHKESNRLQTKATVFAAHLATPAIPFPFANDPTTQPTTITSCTNQAPRRWRLSLFNPIPTTTRTRDGPCAEGL